MKIVYSKLSDAKKIYAMLRREKRVAYTLDLVKDLITAKHSFSLKLTDNEKCIAALGARAEGKNSAWLYYVVVDKNYRQKGCASMLINYFFKEAKKRGVKRIATDTPDVVFYSKFGFKKVGRIPRWYEDRDQVILFRRL